MGQKQVRMGPPKLQTALKPAAPVCQLTQVPDGEHVHRFPTEDEIRFRAYLLWEEVGSPPGDGQVFWHAAEWELNNMGGLR